MKEKVFTKDIIPLLAASFFYLASPMVVNPLIAGFSEHLGAGATVMGLVGGLANLCSLIFQPFFGNLADRISKYKLSTVGTVLLVVACIGYAKASAPIMIVIWRVVNGVGFACCSVCFSTWISNLLPKTRIGFGMGLYGMMNALAMALAPAVGIAVYQRFDPRLAFVSAAGCAAASTLLIQFTRDKGRPVTDRENAKRSFRVVDRNVIPVALVIMCFTIPYCAAQSFLIRYVEMKNLQIEIGMFFTIYAAALLVFRLALRNWFDRISFPVFLGISGVCALLSLACLFHMKTNWEMALAAVFMAGGYGMMCTVSQSAAVLLAEPENRGLANSTYYIGLNSGMALGPMLGGLLYGHVPIQWFFPFFMLTVPLSGILFWGSRKLLAHRK